MLVVLGLEVFCCWPKSGVPGGCRVVGGKCNTADEVISDLLEVDEPDEFFAKLLLLKKKESGT